MGGIEVSRDGGAHQETASVLFVEITSNHCGGGNIPAWKKEIYAIIEVVNLLNKMTARTLLDVLAKIFCSSIHYFISMDA